MTDSVNKAALLAEIDRQRAWWEGVLDAITGERIDTPGIMGDRTPKDLIAHMNAWAQRTITMLVAERDGLDDSIRPWPDVVEAGGGSDDDTTERINDWIYESNRNRPAEEIILESRELWDTMRAFVDGLDEAQLTDASRFPALDGQSVATAIQTGDLFDHYRREHEPDIRRWLKDQQAGT